MSIKEIKLTFTCDIACYDPKKIKNKDLFSAITKEINKQIINLGLIGNEHLRLEGELS